MASIKIHQDQFNYEKRRKGFTHRQIAGAAIGVGIAVGVTALLWVKLGLPYQISMVVGAVLALFPILIGFVPFFNMSAEEAVERYYTHRNHPGHFLLDQTGELADEGQEGVSREYKKRAKKTLGFECSTNN